MKKPFMGAAVVLAVATILAACAGDSVVQPTPSPMAGLNHSASGDTANVNHSPTGTGPGYFLGTVLGPSLPGSGNDSLNTAPKIAGVVVTIFERKPGVDTVAIG